jgi:hypothetical protein
VGGIDQICRSFFLFSPPIFFDITSLLYIAKSQRNNQSTMLSMFDSRSFFVLCIVVAASPGIIATGNSVGTQDNYNDNRSLLRAWKNVKTEWPECVGKLRIDCLELMERELGFHPFRFLRPEVFVPRDEEDYNNTYYKVGISVNMLDEVTGDKNKGAVCYTLPWNSTSTGSLDLGCWDCSAMRGDDCCSMIMASVPDADTNGNHLECFIYQDPATPDVDQIETVQARRGYIAKEAPYYIMKHNVEFDVYVKLDVNATRIDEFRLNSRIRLIVNQRALEQIVADKRVSREDLARLTRELSLHTSPIMSAQNLISELDHFLEGNEQDQFLHVAGISYIYSVMATLIHLIDSFLLNRGQFFTPLNVLVTSQDVVIVPPKLGAKFLPIQKFRPLDPRK